ncbi:MAG: HAMP domain-containing histidine kinase, partial [Acidisphaera sp.]|nr:HAMP domain-containing histidine kinase [Acidisphaera sp.]
MRAPPLRRSLSARLLWLTVGTVLLTQILVFIPSLAHERGVWLARHVRDAHLAALAVAAAPDGMVDARTREELLRLSGAEMIRLQEPSGSDLVLPPPSPVTPDAIIDLRTESGLAGVRSALADLVGSGDRQLEIVAQSPMRPGTLVTLLVHESGLARALSQFARTIALVSLLIAGVTGALLYLVLLRLLVRPMRRITDSIAAFRAAPEGEAPLDPAGVSLFADDEMAVAGRELAAMQFELRAALWRNARLAALGTAVAKMSHDLRGILSPALLAADRLTGSADASVRRLGEVVVRAVERASELVAQTLEYAREGRPPLVRARFGLRALIDEAAESAAAGRALRVRNAIPADLQVEADRNQLFRVLVNLLRNAAEAGAASAGITASPAPGALAILLEDDGPGLPEPVRANLFRP